MALHNIRFTNQVAGQFKLNYNISFTSEFNKNLNKTQLFLDKSVGTNLEPYVSYKTGAQEKSIANAGTYGKGYVMINVKYAHYQAYSPLIKKRVGKRGTRPFERMKTDKYETILRETAEYARRLNDG